jgi:hypothetical protein
VKYIIFIALINHKTDNMKKYNGWANWHTWNAYNWLSSDYYTSKMLEADAKKMNAEQIKEIWEAGFETTDGIITEKVNFEEILKAFKE